MPKNTVFKNVVILGISGIIAKMFDFALRAYYSRTLGAEGTGLMSLGFSLHGVMLTFATAGLGVAVSKITSEYMERKNQAAVRACMNCALFGVCMLSLILLVVVFAGADFIAERGLGDIRASAGICALAPSVLFMGVSYCLKGYFYAARKGLQPASSEILEQLVKFAAIVGLLKASLPYGVEYGCAAVFAGITIGEFSSCAYLTLFYLKEHKRLKKTAAEFSNKEAVLKLLGISIPSMVTSFCCSSLRASEEVLIVSALKRGNMDHSSALSMLGILRGMAMPLLVLPLNLAGSVLSLLVPEISRAEVGGREKLRKAAARVYRVALSVGFAVAAVFMVFGEQITTAFYGTASAAGLVVMLAPLCPVMFADSASSSMLNGMGKQLRLLGFTLADFALRYTIIYLALPGGQQSAYAAMTVASNIFTCVLSSMSVYLLIKPQKPVNIKLTKTIKYGIVNKQ